MAPKVAFFFEVWREEGESETYRYPDEVIAAFACSVEFATWGADIPIGSHTFRAIHELMMARPYN